MKRLPYLLILLLTAQADDYWAVAPVLPSAPLADDNDEYLPAQRRPQEQRPFSRQKPVFEAVTPPDADFSFVPRGVPSEWNLTTPFGPPPLYVFLSLRI
jgi:hypothetical protein